MIKYKVYVLVISSLGIEYHSIIGMVDAINRNDACLKFREWIYKDKFLTARKVL